MKVLAIDPGTTEGAAVMFDGKRFTDPWKQPNENAIRDIKHRIAGWEGSSNEDDDTFVVLEMVAHYGMAVGAEVFETCVVIGKIMQLVDEHGQYAPSRMTRIDVKKHLCHKTVGVNDSVIRQRLIDMFGPGKDVAIGKKKSPGPLFGLSGDMWAAAALAVVWWEKNVGPLT